MTNSVIDVHLQDTRNLLPTFSLQLVVCHRQQIERILRILTEGATELAPAKVQALEKRKQN